MKLISAIFACLLMFSGAASAALITFDGVFDFANDGEFVDVDDFRFTTLDEGGVGPFITINNFADPCGGHCLFNANSAATVMTRVDGGAFSLSAFDFVRRPGDSNGVRSAVFLNLIGTTLAGDIFDTTVDLADTMQTYSSSVFYNITSLTFSAGALGSQGLPQDREFMLDSINVGDPIDAPEPASVPEPVSIAIMALGLVGLLSTRRVAKRS